jgi:hypothetical protein
MDPAVLPFIGFPVLILVIIAIVFWILTKRKSPWGITFSRKPCPRCGTMPPVVRVPKGLDETIFGGWTCSNCGCKVDKYGRERAA